MHVHDLPEAAQAEIKKLVESEPEGDELRSALELLQDQYEIPYGELVGAFESARMVRMHPEHLR